MNVIRKSESISGVRFAALEPIAEGSIVKYCNYSLGTATRRVGRNEILQYWPDSKTDDIDARDYCPCNSPVPGSFGEYLENSIEAAAVANSSKR